MTIAPVMLPPLTGDSARNRLAPRPAPPVGRRADIAGVYGQLRIREIRSVDALIKLALTWNEVLEGSETASPFLTHEWVLTWLESFGADHEPWILVVEDNRGPCAIAPLALVRRSLGPFSYRCMELIGTGPLRFLGMGLSDRSDFILARRRGESLVAILGHLAKARAEWDVADLRFVPEESTTATLMPTIAAEFRFGLSRERCSESPYLRLDGTHEEWLAGRSRNYRSGIRRKQRHLEELGEVRIDDLDPEAGLEAAFSVSERSWKAERGSALFQHANVRSFFARLAPRLRAGDRMGVRVLRLDGRPIAHELYFQLAGRVWSYDHSYDREFQSRSPGQILTANVIEQGFAQGFDEYDFMRGEEEYKFRWTSDARYEQQLVLDSGSRRARLVRELAFRAKWWLKHQPLICEAQARIAGLINRLTHR